MPDNEACLLKSPSRTPWNKGKLIGAKPPLRPKHVWSIRTKLQVEGRTRDLAMFNLAIDSKLRGCDVVSLKVEDVAPHGQAVDRAIVRQRKTGQPVRFELTVHTREAVDAHIKAAGKKPGQFLFVGHRGPDRAISTRQYARLVSQWVAGIGLDPSFFGPTPCAEPRRRSSTDGLETCVPCNCFPERRHTAREQQAEARITYRFHPRFGETVRIRRRLERSGVEFIVVHQPDGSFACLPAWMTHDTASRFEIGMAPAFSLTTLRALRNEVDALLSLLASESTTERPEHDAPIQKSPTKPLRGRAAARRVVAQAKGRTHSNRGGSAARDCGESGKSGKPGERQ